MAPDELKLAHSVGARRKPHWALAGLGCVLLGGLRGALARGCAALTD